jgi:sulfur relay (sulfurtransferase) complex TusBCD TusD component (DsrE family)
MKYLFVFNDSPCGNQRSYNGPRLAVALVKDSLKVNFFLFGDGVTASGRV